MYRSNTSILFVIVTCLALFLYITYSTIGAIESNQANQFHFVSSSVDFSEGIINAPTYTENTQYYSSDVAASDFTPQNSHYEVSTISSVESRHASYSTGSSSNYSNSSSSNENSGSSSMSGAFIASSSKSKCSESESSASKAIDAGQMENVSSLTSDGSLSSSVNRQSAKKSSNNSQGWGPGGRDPGGKDPKGPPIPAGNGIWILIILAAMYAIKKSNLSISSICKRIKLSNQKIIKTTNLN